MAITYTQIKNATLEDIKANKELGLAAAKAYNPTTNPENVYNLWIGGSRSFTGDKPYMFKSGANIDNSAFLESAVESYSVNKTQENLAKVQSGVTDMTKYWGQYGIDVSDAPSLSNALSIYNPYTNQATNQATGWYDEATGQDTPVGVGTPRQTTQTNMNTTTQAPVAGNTQYQILNVDAMNKYSPSQYQRLSDGRVVLNPGVNPIAGTVKETSFTLPNQAPTSAGQVKSGSTVNIGGVDYSLPDISGSTGAIAGTQSLIGSEEQLFQQRLEQTKQLQESKNQASQSMLTKLLGSKSPEQALIDAWQQLGIDPAQHYAQQKAIIAEIESLTKDYNSVVAARDAQLATSQGSMASMNFINNQQAQINRNAAVVLNQKAANINAKTATLEALQGNFASAQTFVNQAVQAAAAQYEYNYNSYKIFKEQNDEMFNALDSVYQDAYNYQLQKAQNEYETKKAEAKQVGNLMLEYPTAGININDTYNDAIVKAQKIAAVEYNKKGTGTGVKPKTFTVGSETINETGDTWTDTVNYLKALKRQGMFSDFSYNQQVNALVQAEGLELNEDNINAMKSRVNNELKKSDIIAPEKTITKPSEKVISEIGRLQPLGTTSPQTTSPMIKETTGGFWSSLFGL